MNASFRNAFAGLVIATAIASRPASAQFASASLTHTVSVTVPPRVKVKATALSGSELAARTSPKARIAGGLALNVRATQRWVLAIASSGRRTSANRIQWSTDASNFAALSRETAPVAGGTGSDASAHTDLFLRDTSVDEADSEPATLLLTVVTP